MSGPEHPVARALIVDDDDVLRTALIDALTINGRIEVVGEAATAEEAIAQAEANRPDLILMDLRMPGMGGLEGTRRLRTLLPDAAILVFTAYADTEFIAGATHAGADGFLVKGTPLDAILATIEQAIRQR